MAESFYKRYLRVYRGTLNNVTTSYFGTFKKKFPASFMTVTTGIPYWQTLKGITNSLGIATIILERLMF